MNSNLLVLMLEAMAVYLLVLWTHSLRRRVGLGPFYALLGGITAVMSWITDAGVVVQAGGITFMVGSTVFYTALLLGVFIVYVFDGPPATRVAILTVAGVSAMVPVIAAVLHAQMKLLASSPLGYVPLPSLRINAASVAATVADLVFLAMAWEFLGHPRFRMPTWSRAFLTLLGVMWLDVLLFATGAFAGTPGYASIMSGTFISRFFISLFAFPFLYAYLEWQGRATGAVMEMRPILAILKEVARIRADLRHAEDEIADRKRIEDALRESEERYRTFMDATDDLVIIKDGGFRYLFVNTAAARLYGRPAKELVGKTDADMLPPAAAARCLETDREALAQRRVVAHVEPVGDRWYETRKFRLKLHDGSIGLGLIIHDITDRRRAEQVIAESEQKYRLLVERANDGIILVQDGKVVFANARMAEMDGSSVERLVGTPFADHVAPDHLAALAQNYARRMAGEPVPAVYETVLRRADGSPAPCELNAGLVPFNGRSADMVIIRDITERKKAEAHLRFQAQLLDSVSESVVATDLENRILYWGPGAERLYGYAAAEVMGRPYREFAGGIHPPDEESFRRRLLADGVWEGEHEQRRRDGSTFWSATHISVVRDEQGRPAGFIGIDWDIGDRRRAEEARREMQDILNDVGRIAKIGGWKMDLVTRKATWTQGTYDIVEIEPGQPIPGPDEHVDWYLPEFRPMIAEAMRALIEEDKPLEFEAPLRTAEGRIKWCRAIGRALREGGKAVALYGTFQDITERRDAEQALRASEAQLSNALQMARAGHWEYDVASDTFTFNDNFYRIFRTTAAEVGGYKMRSADYARRFCHPDDLPVVGKEIKASNATTDPHYNRQLEHRILYADGQVGYIAVRFFIVKDDRGRTIRTYGVNQDITERKEAEAALRDQMAELRHWHQVTLGREQRIMELKGEINALLSGMGKPVKYESIVETNGHSA